MKRLAWDAVIWLMVGVAAVAIAASSCFERVKQDEIRRIEEHNRTLKRENNERLKKLFKERGWDWPDDQN